MIYYNKSCQDLLIVERSLAELTIRRVVGILEIKMRSAGHLLIFYPLFQSLLFSFSPPLTLLSLSCQNVDSLVYLQPSKVGLHDTLCMRRHHAVLAHIHSVLKAELVRHFPLWALAQPHPNLSPTICKFNSFCSLKLNRFIHWFG